MTPLNTLCVIFDLDGTLIETAPDLAGAMNRVLINEGYAPLPVSQVRPLIGHGGREMLRGALTHF